MGPYHNLYLLTDEYVVLLLGNLRNHMNPIGVGVLLNSKSLTDENPPINGSITFRSGGIEFIIR